MMGLVCKETVVLIKDFVNWGEKWIGHRRGKIRLIQQQNGNVSWRRRAQIKQLAWPMAERQTGHRE